MKVYENIFLIEIEEIKPYWNNPRQNDDTVRELVKVIPKFGFNVPLLVDEDNVIVKGHARYYAAKQLGLQVVPCIISTATEEQNKLDRIYDNAIQDMSGWDHALLNSEMKSIDELLESNGYDESSFEEKIELISTKGERKPAQESKSGDVVKGVLCPKCSKLIPMESINEII